MSENDTSSSRDQVYIGSVVRLGLDGSAKAGLRGAVKTCLEITIQFFRDIESRSKCENTLRSSWITTVFDKRGNTLSQKFRDYQGEVWQLINQYDALGRLEKTLWLHGLDIAEQHTRQYDRNGRLLSIISTKTPQNSAFFEYDSKGRNVKIQVSGPGNYIPNCSQAGTPFEIADRAPNLKEGGRAITKYDRFDRPVEVEICDMHSAQVGTARRVYDEAGGIVSEELLLVGSFGFDASGLESISAIRFETLDESIRTALGSVDSLGHYRIEYEYDSSGRRSRSTQWFFGQNEVTEYFYNNEGNLEREIKSGTNSEHIPSGTADTSYLERAYIYRYDEHGNWVERVARSRSLPNGDLALSTTQVRILEYY